MGNCLLTRGNPVGLVLLWTNPSPSSAFAPQTIELDLSNYEWVVISVFVASSALNLPIVYHWGRVGDSIDMQPAVYNSTFRGRSATTSTTGVAFSAGRYYNSYNDGNNGSVENIQCIPHQIFGLRLKR